MKPPRDGEESIALEDLTGPQLDKILETIEHADRDKPQSYELDYDRLEQAFAGQAAELAQKWDRGAADSQMESFDKDAKTYRYTQEQYGRSLKQEQLVEELMEAARKGEFRSGYSLHIGSHHLGILIIHQKIQIVLHLHIAGITGYPSVISDNPLILN